MTQEILLKSGTTGTTIVVFDTIMSEPSAFDFVYNSFLTFDSNNQPSNIYNYNGDVLYIRTGNYNNFVPLSEVTNNYITGYTGILNIDRILKESEKSRYKKKYIENSLFYNSESKSFFFFEDKPIDDVFVNINLNRTFDSLNTLSVYNNLLNSFPTQECTTGVVFGKLEAIQKVVNPETGKNYRIPLSDVPIGIFNPTNNFPNTTSVDENGNRIRLGFTPIISDNLKNSHYFNQISINFDEQFLLSSEGMKTVPNEYQYITKTNRDGEFIIYDVPIGPQVIIFEVDLLKQGLTKDEVALNFFPYPSEQNANIDTIPHFFFRQIPIDVVPTWGDIQSGYTEVNISANLDLRKWATYFIPPTSVYGLNIEQAPFEAGISNPLSVFVRDMTKTNFSFDSAITISDRTLPFKPKDSTELVEIPNILDRDLDQEFEWYNEFSQIKKNADFRMADYSVFKVPANIYSPFVMSTKELEKNNNIKKYGTWFCGYQFNLSYLNNGFFRATGYHRNYTPGNELITSSRSHYFLNRDSSVDDTLQSINDTLGVSVGKFPYEKPWSDVYPNQVKIPKPPEDSKQYPSNEWYSPSSDGENLIVAPKFPTGDKPGMLYSGTNAGGFGIQFNKQGGNYFSSIFARRINNSYLYKYENNVSKYERYANGYQPHQDVNKMSVVFNGETYQRTEAGFGYFLKPEGWPDLVYLNRGDVSKKDNKFSFGSRTYRDVSVNTYKEGVFVDSKLNLFLKTDNPTDLVEGGLDIYRLIDPLLVNSIEPEVTPTYAKFYIRNVYRKCRAYNELVLAAPDSSNEAYLRANSDDSNSSTCQPFGGEIGGHTYFISFSIKVRNVGSVPAEIQGTKVNVGDEYDFGFIGRNFGDFSFNETNRDVFVLELPGNDGFDPAKYSFDKCSYEFIFGEYNDGSSNSFDRDETIARTIGTNLQKLDAKPESVNYFLNSSYSNSVLAITTQCGGHVNALFKRGDVVFPGIILGANNNFSKIPGTNINHCVFSTGSTINPTLSPGCRVRQKWKNNDPYYRTLNMRWNYYD